MEHFLAHSSVQDRIGALAPEQLRCVINVVNQQLASPLTSAVLAQAAQMKQQEFCREFEASVGVDPDSFILRRRLERALELLKDPWLTDAEISAVVGFAHPDIFRAEFRKVAGVSPMTYRARIRSKPVLSLSLASESLSGRPIGHSMDESCASINYNQSGSDY